jgi:hypothetical protein
MTGAAMAAIMIRMDLRTVALVACGAGVASAVVPMWASTRQLLAAPYTVLKSQKDPPPDITVFDEQPAREPSGLLS